MKLLFSLCIILIFALPVLSQEKENKIHHCFFEDTAILTGLGLAYSPDLETFGVSAGAFYVIHEKVFFGPEVSYFNANNKEVLDLNLVGHYIFETKLFGIYPLIGANYTIEEEEGEHSESEQKEAFGLIYGVGLHRNFGKWTTFIEYSRVESELPDQFITVGLMFHIGLK